MAIKFHFMSEDVNDWRKANILRAGRGRAFDEFISRRYKTATAGQPH